MLKFITILLSVTSLTLFAQAGNRTNNKALKTVVVRI
jgi:hypothetical protein